MAGPLSATQRVQAAKALFVARKIMRARQTRRAAMFDRLRAMVQHQNGLLVAALVAESSSKGERRTVSRALGSWRGSTLSGYLRDGDDQTYLDDFRCTKPRFESLVHQLRDSPLDVGAPKVLTSDWRKVRRTQKALQSTDPPSSHAAVQGGVCLVCHGPRWADQGACGCRIDWEEHARQVFGAIC